MRHGTRVVRGPDWLHGEADGGEGFLGTVVKVLPTNCVLVRWDIGTETMCRAGQDGAFDLRIYDNKMGGEHTGITCNGQCGKKTITGFRWKCLVCPDKDACTDCYMFHMEEEAGHPFVRFNVKRALVERVPPRRKSRRVSVRGIFPGARVVKCAASDSVQDEKVGVVKEITNLPPDMSLCAVKVEWEGPPAKKADNGSPDLPIYRIGAEAKVEVKLVMAASPGYIYIDHLPVLDLTRSVDRMFNEGDKVRVDLNLDTFRPLMRNHGGWVDELENILGVEGTIMEILPNACAQVNFQHAKRPYLVYMNTLTKLASLTAGDNVRVIQDNKKMKKLQTGHGGWQDAYISILGSKGRVVRIEESMDALVEVEGATYLVNPSCLVYLDSRDSDSPTPADMGLNLPGGVKPAAPLRKLPANAYRQKPQPGVSIGVGARVVRGPDWSPDFLDQDGGEGHIGSIVEVCVAKATELYPPQCVVVQWDGGQRNVYRAGYEKACDLRLYDNAGVGIVHNHPCSSCKEEKIFGILWRCSRCTGEEAVNLCSLCYNADQHNIRHQFLRLDCPDAEGVQVPMREISKKIAAKGIFEGCEVQRGPDWRWADQDGGNGKSGEVIAIVNFSPDTDRDAAEVTWGNGYTNVYRLGYKGKFDIQSVNPSSGGFYYKDHLPFLKINDEDDVAKSSPPVVSEEGATALPGEKEEGRFKPGDKVKIEIDVDLLRSIEQSRGAWEDHMTECLCKTGTVIVSKGIDITVDFNEAGRWTFHESVLNQLKEFVPGEKVKVLSSVPQLQTLQASCGWNDQMLKVAGQSGVVESIDEDGDIMVHFPGGVSWTFNPECLLSDDTTPDLPKEDKSPEKPPAPLPSSEDELFDALFESIFAGEIERTRKIIEKAPQMLLMDKEGKYAMHQACHSGQIDIVKVLFQFTTADVLLDMEDGDKNTPLLVAIRGGHRDMVEFLIQKGAKKSVSNKNMQTAVHSAVSMKNKEMLQVLRDHDFDINAKDMLGQSAIFDAIVSGIPDIIDMVLSWPGLQVNYQDSIGFSPFCTACRNGCLKAAKRIMEICPGELNKPKPDGFTGLHLAIYNNKTEMVEFLLSQPSIEVDTKTGEGRSPLHTACQEGNLHFVKLLLEKGADITAVDKCNKGCLHFVSEVPQNKVGEEQKTDRVTLDIARHLFEKGAKYHMDVSDKFPEDYLSGSTKADFLELKQRFIRQDRGGGFNTAQTSASRPQGDVSGPQSLPVDLDPVGGQRSQADQGPVSPSLSASGRAQGTSFFGNLPSTSGENKDVAKPSQEGRRQDDKGGSLIIEQLDPAQGQVGNQGQVMAEGQGQDARDPEMCESCEEEPYRYKMEPCHHLLCGDCIPGRKQKKKMCAVCGKPAGDIVELQ